MAEGLGEHQLLKFQKAVRLQDIVPENTYDGACWGINQVAANQTHLYAHLKDGSLREFALPELELSNTCPEWRSDGMTKLQAVGDTVYGLSEEAFSLFSTQNFNCTFSIDCDSEITDFVVCGTKLMLCSVFDKENESTQRALKVLDAKTGARLHSIRIQEEEDNDHFYGITLQDKYFFGGLERTVDVYDLEVFQRVKCLDLGDNTEPEHLAVTWVSAQESFLFCVCQKTLKIFELAEGRCVQNISLEDSASVISMVALTHGLLLIFMEDASFKVLNVVTKSWQQLYKHPKEVITNSIAFNTSHLYASVTYKGRPQLLVWEFNWAS